MNKLSKNLTAALVAVFLCLNVSADTSLKVGGFSHHLSGGDYNSFHRVLILNHNGHFGGYFKNSYYEDTFTLGKSFKFDWYELHAGITYGYRGCLKAGNSNGDRGICPMIAPEVVAHRLPLKPSIALFGLDAVVLSFNF